MFPPIGPSSPQAKVDGGTEVSTSVDKRAANEEPITADPEPDPAQIVCSPDFLGLHELGADEDLRVGEDPQLELALEGDAGTHASPGTLCLRVRCSQPETSSVIWITPALTAGLAQGQQEAISSGLFTQTHAESFAIREIGPYRVKLVAVDASRGGEERLEDAAPAPTSPTSILKDPTAGEAGRRFRSSPATAGPHQERLLLLATVAVDRPGPPPAPRPLRHPHLAVGESKEIWLSSKLRALQERTFGAPGSEDLLELSLHVLPYATGAAAQPQGGAASGTSLWRVSLDAMRLSPTQEGHGELRLDGKKAKSSIVVGDYRIEVVQRAAPMGECGVRAHKGAPRVLRSEYALLLLHLKLRLTRISEEEADAASMDQLFRDFESDADLTDA